ncbi:hypothetical protein ACUOCP_53910, partial [Escherichia sp. R-CC3]
MVNVRQPRDVAQILLSAVFNRPILPLILMGVLEKNVVQQLRQHANDLLVVFQVACAAATFVHPSH